MLLDDPLAQGQADACPGVLIGGVQALKYEEDPVGILGLDADPVILDQELPQPICIRYANMDEGSAIPTEFKRIAEQVLKNLAELAGICPDGRQWIAGDGRLGLFDHDISDR